MTPIRAAQAALLAPAAALLADLGAETGGGPAAAPDVIDAAASRIGGVDLDGYRAVLRIDARLDAAVADAWAAKLLDLVDGSGVPRRLALATLAQPGVTDSTRRTTGAYYTDFRLARYLARRTAALASLTATSTVVDPAAGTGVLLVALAEEICGTDQGAARELVGHGLSAVDLDPACRRGTIAALASLTADLPAVTALAARVRTADSLLADGSLWHPLRRGADGRFDAVIGNPPWERLRLTRHERLRAAGSSRHYGADYDGADYHGAGEDPAGTGLRRMRGYIAELAKRYPLLGDREIDLSHAFLALSAMLVRPGGSLGMLVPAGLIRAQGTRSLREHLFTAADEVDLTVLHNRSRFFGIDTRFKFLAVSARICAGRSSEARPGGATLSLRRCQGDGVRDGAPVRIPFADLAAARRDLSVPEVSGDREWRIFRHLSATGWRPDDPDSPWAMRISREVDMTRGRPLFSRSPDTGAVPVVEGRMVGQYRSGAKTYVRGSGRAATWRPLPMGEADAAAAQFFVHPARLPDVARARLDRPRIGFCDIVGQTNERTLQAALIQPGRICGNKVPTVDLLCGSPLAREMLFLAAANSLVVDWFVRRVVTTSLNFFILRDLPLPPLDTDSATGRRLVELAEFLVAAERNPECPAHRIAESRAEIDLAIAACYRLDLADLPLLLADFPLLDRHQPALPGEARSTVTPDLLLGAGGDARARTRYLAATSQGAVAYVPEEFAGLTR
jgi:predicted RNA methylase